VLEITACSLQLPGQNIIIHGFSTPIWSRWEVVEMCKQLYTTISLYPPTKSSALCNIWNSHSGTAEHSVPLWCCAISSLESQKTNLEVTSWLYQLAGNSFI
jgi:hypothetical protein